MIMTRFGAFRLQFTKFAVHKGNFLSMQREDFRAPKKDSVFALRKQNKGAYSRKKEDSPHDSLLTL